MNERRPPADEAVSRSRLLGPAGVLLVIAGLGLALAGASFVAGLLRGLNQDVPAGISTEPASRE